MKLFSKSRGNKIFWGIIIFFFVILLLEVGLRYYEDIQGQRAVQRLAEELERQELGREQAKTADEVGGQTPQETLAMFISAVEAGDYELASKYFVIDKQEEWRDNLGAVKNVNDLLFDLQEALGSTGSYSLDRTSFSIHKPILVSFVLYPSGNWKIEKI
ncbi:hypothetical protein ACFLZC_00075 [Patescibacteria group bacterium]